MRIWLILVFILFFISACSTYYKGNEPKQFIFSSNDTLAYLWLVKTDTTESLFEEIIYRRDDTIFTEQISFDSTYSLAITYLVGSDALYLQQYYSVVSLFFMFYEIDKNLSFSFDPKHIGKANEQIKFVSKDMGFFIKRKSKSFASELDSVILGDSIVSALRVDVRYKYVFKGQRDRKNKRKYSEIISYFYYPGLGPIYIKSKKENYQAKVISITHF